MEGVSLCMHGWMDGWIYIKAGGGESLYSTFVIYSRLFILFLQRPGLQSVEVLRYKGIKVGDETRGLLRFLCWVCFLRLVIASVTFLMRVIYYRSLMGVLRSCYRMPRDLGCGFTCLCVRMCIRSLVAGNLGFVCVALKRGEGRCDGVVVRV